MSAPSRGQIWQVAFQHAGGIETLPCLILSDNQINQNSANLTVVLSTMDKKLDLRSHIQANESGKGEDIFICCEQILTVSTDRCIKAIDEVPDKILAEVDETVKMVLGF
ncbi:MAG: type II toxin-antitoxin system PemK/MazF family toxin [Balneolales bacterium]